ncbi:MAG: hypothetical protein HQL75_00390 [Magnetococcales bacterium]|nr:hypothetical protein [Magnetococcales bacterium]
MIKLVEITRDCIGCKSCKDCITWINSTIQEAFVIKPDGATIYIIPKGLHEMIKMEDMSAQQFAVMRGLFISGKMPNLDDAHWVPIGTSDCILWINFDSKEAGIVKPNGKTEEFASTRMGA